MRIENRAGSERALVGLIVFEVLVFAVFGPNFFTAGNAFEIVRLGVELGLLALALTPVIVSGGIDLSVGSMMGLCAVAFGYLWRDAHLPVWAAGACTLGIGLAGGALNAVLISRFRAAPLIVTLGSYSLFRGIAEGLTRGVDNFSQFPPSFLALGQSYLGGIVPAQMPVFLVFAAGFYLLLHRSIHGRAMRAIGFSPGGARWAGIPVESRLILVYTLSGFTAAVASLIYVAHLGQAKSDAGTGYELLAITAVVLGGTAITGGKGSIFGTPLGLTAIVVLQNGLRLAALPAELSGILTSAILIGTIALGRVKRAPSKSEIEQAPQIEQAEDEVKNSQVAVLSAVILAGALIVAGTNVWLVRSLKAPEAKATGSNAGAGKQITVGMLPKAKGDPYFVSCKRGAEASAAENGVELIWDGPTDVDPAKQNEIVEAWITRGVSTVAVSVVNAPGISTVLRKARERGIKVLTWDADAEPNARDFFINQATPQGIGSTLADEAAAILGNKGDFAIVTGALSAANQNEWIQYIKQTVAAKYPGMNLVAICPSDDDRDRAFAETQTLLKVYPKMRAVIVISAPAVPGAGEAVNQSGRQDVKVTGLSLPNLCKPYVHAGVVHSVVLWDTQNLGYLTVLASKLAAEGTLHAGVTSIDAGKLGKIEVKGDNVLLGKPMVFNKANIDKFDF